MSAVRRRRRANRTLTRIAKTTMKRKIQAGTDISGIPNGWYCYNRCESSMEHGRGRACPYWDLNPKYSKHNRGYCSLMERGDWEPRGHGSGLLWDQIKECGIRQDGHMDIDGNWVEDDKPNKVHHIRVR